MRLVLALLMAWSTLALSQERPRDIDPNTKTEGGADVRSSGANAGTGASTDDKPAEPRIDERGEVARPERTDPDQDKPTSERKPQERDEPFKPAPRK